MGQGLYTMLGYGVLNPPWLDEESHGEALWHLKEHLRLEQSYECEREYLLSPVAIDEPWLQEQWHLQPMPDWVPRVQPYDARRLRVSATRARPFLEDGTLAQRWAEAQVTYAQEGLMLPAAYWVLVSEWD